MILLAQLFIFWDKEFFFMALLQKRSRVRQISPDEYKKEEEI